MKCPWCQSSQFKLTDHRNQFYSCQICFSAGSTLALSGNSNSLNWYLVYYKQYVIYFMLELNSFMIYYNEFGMKQLLDIDYLPNINQNNIEEKLKLLLTFE